MMNNDVHLNKTLNRLNFSDKSNMKLNRNDDRCIDLLEIINMSEKTQNSLSDNSNLNQMNNILDGKDNNNFYLEIMSALEKKDFQKIVTLALSQSQDNQKNGSVLNESMSLVDKSSCKSMDNNIIENITNIIHSEPKNNASVLRATVAPIRNEPIVNCSSKSFISCPMTNKQGVKTNGHVTRCSTSPNSTDFDLNTLFSFGKFSKGINGSQGQYQQNILGNNSIMCIMSPSMTGDNLRQIHTNNYPFLVPQNVLISSQPCQSVVTECSITAAIPDTIKTPLIVSTTPTTSSSNLIRILPKPGNINIAPRTPQNMTQALLHLSQPQQFKRSSNSRRKGVKSGRTNKDMDNIMMAWETADQSLSHKQQSFLNNFENDGIEGSELLDDVGSSMDNYENYDRNINIITGLDEFLDGLYRDKQCASVTMVENVMEEVCQEDIVEYGCVTIVRGESLMRATLTGPVGNNTSVKVVTVTSKEWLSISDNNKMVQVLFSELGRHSNFLSPTLKGLLPWDNDTDLFSTIVTGWGEEQSVHDDDCIFFRKVNDKNLSLQSFLLSGHSISSWLQTHQHSSKWTQNGDTVNWSPSLEVPVLTRLYCGGLLRKRSNFHQRIQSRKKQFHPQYSSDKYRRQINSIRRKNDCKRANSNILAPTTTGNLKIRISLANCLDSTATSVDIQMESIPNIDNSNNGLLLYKHSKIRVSELDSKKTSPCLDTLVDSRITSDIRVLLESIYDQSHVPLIKKTDVAINKPVRPRKVTSKSKSKPRKKSPKKNSNTASKPQNKKSCDVPIIVSGTLKQSKKNESDIKRIFCTRKEDRRSSVLQSHTPLKKSPKKMVHSPSKKKRTKKVKDNPPIIMKLCSKKMELLAMEVVSPVSNESEEIEEDDRVLATSDSIKLLIKRSGHSTYKSQISSVQPPSISDQHYQESVILVDDNYHYSPPVNLAPPNHRRIRAQQAALQFSPGHSSSDSDVGVAHNEISSLLQRQEQREPLSECGDTNKASIFPPLPVPYLIGTDPLVFMDPHEIDLVTVKNFRYKKMSSNPQKEPTEDQVPTDNLFSDPNNTSEMFVPGCFLENDKSTVPWNRSSPPMPVLAPQEPFTNIGNISKSSQRSHSKKHAHSSRSQRTQQLPEQRDHFQQSPLCITTKHQYSSSSNQIEIIPPDSKKSPSYHHSDYPYQTHYNSSFYLGDPTTQSMLQASTNSSKDHLQSSSGNIEANVSNDCSSHLSDYSYCQNQNHQKIQSQLSVDTSFFPPSPTSYQTIIPELSSYSSTVKSTSKRSASRTQISDQSLLPPTSSSSTPKKRKETSTDNSSYPCNSDLYNSAANYPGFDYYGTGFSNIFNNMDQMKLYEQCAREYSLQLGSNMPGIYPNIQLSNAMAEYCKQAVAFNPSIVAAASNNATSPDNNPLSLSTNIQNSDYSNSYTAYAMSQPYSMYSSFGMPK